MYIYCRYTVFILVAVSTCALSQNSVYPPYNVFNGCDYYETIELGRVYDVFSPYFPEKYAPGTNCRWSGCAPYGTNIVIKCADMKIPTVIFTNLFFVTKVEKKRKKRKRLCLDWINRSSEDFERVNVNCSNKSECNTKSFGVNKNLCKLKTFIMC